MRLICSIIRATAANQLIETLANDFRLTFHAKNSVTFDVSAQITGKSPLPSGKALPLSPLTPSSDSQRNGTKDEQKFAVIVSDV
jgi:hypothetical protein